MTNEKLIAELIKIVGHDFPIKVEYDLDGVRKISYEKTWKVGRTIPIEKKSLVQVGIVIGGEEKTLGQQKIDVTGYKEDYKDMSLTEAQVAKVDEFIKNNV